MSFVHERLDHSIRSIRLVKINPNLAPGGLIQCDITNATVEAPYVCLSYRWGGPKPAHQILVNGYLFVIRQNLYHFLKTAQKRLNEAINIDDWYWIDAMCIDQSDISERMHQVAQMGEIYSKARHVYAWLGTCYYPKSIRYFFEGPIQLEDHKEIFNHFCNHEMNISYYVTKNRYWSRAWITQEIMLAQNVIVLLGMRSTSFVFLLARIRCYIAVLEARPAYRTMLEYHSLYYQFAPRLLDGVSNGFEESLISLLSRFRSNESSIPHDRVFSLFSLCRRADVFEADYSMQINHLARKVLCQNQPALSICSAAMVATILGLRSPPTYSRPHPPAKHDALILKLKVERVMLIRGRSDGFQSLRLEHDGLEWTPLLYGNRIDVQTARENKFDRNTREKHCSSKLIGYMSNRLIDNPTFSRLHWEDRENSQDEKVELSHVIDRIFNSEDRTANVIRDAKHGTKQVCLSESMSLEIECRLKNVCVIRVALFALPKTLFQLESLCAAHESTTLPGYCGPVTSINLGYGPFPYRYLLQSVRHDYFLDPNIKPAYLV